MLLMKIIEDLLKHKEAGEKMKHIFLSKLRLEMMKQADKNELNVGSLSSVLNLQVLQQIKSRLYKKNDLHQDFEVFLDMLTEQLDDKWIGKHIKGFIQLNYKKPFLLVTFSEKSLLQIIKIVEYGHVFIYLDTTRTLIGRPIGIDKKVYLYLLILLSDSEKAPLPVAEFISCTVCHILHCFYPL